MKNPLLDRLFPGRQRARDGHDRAGIQRQFEGRQAIYVEDDMIAPVRIHSILVDKRGLTAQATALPTPGLTDFEKTWTIRASWDHFRFSDDYWYAKYLRWRLWFDQDTFERVTHLYAQQPEEKPLLERWRDVSAAFRATV
jgi:hypothetical protein